MKGDTSTTNHKSTIKQHLTKFPFQDNVLDPSKTVAVNTANLLPNCFSFHLFSDVHVWCRLVNLEMATKQGRSSPVSLQTYILLLYHIVYTEVMSAILMDSQLLWG